MVYATKEINNSKKCLVSLKKNISQKIMSIIMFWKKNLIIEITKIFLEILTVHK